MRDPDPREVIAGLPAVVYRFVLSADGLASVPYASDGTRELLGVDPHELLRAAHDMSGAVHPDDREGHAASILRSAQTLETWHWRGRFVRRDGEVRHVRAVSSPRRLADGSTQWDGVLYDETPFHAELEERERALQRFHGAFEQAPIGMALIGLDGRFERVNGALAKMVGRPAAALEGVSFRRVMADPAALAPAAAAHLAEGRQVVRGEHALRHADGHIVWADLSTTLLVDEHGRPTHFLAHAVDITDQKAIEAELEQLAAEDDLTGLWGRRRFEDELRRQADRCRRYGETAAVLVLDLDDFKDVNDTFGHAAGDEVLRAVAAAMRSRLRATDGLARLGGDEFAVLLPRIGADDAADVARAVRRAIADCDVEVAGRPVATTASVGLAFLDGDEATAEDALVAADMAMYDAKRAAHARRPGALGPPRSPRQRVSEALAMATLLRDALADDRLVLHGQPIIDFTTGDVALYELLVRMPARDGTVLAPARFLPLAERLGLATEVDRSVIERGLAEQVRWERLGHHVTFAVNLSGQSASDPRLPGFVDAAIARTGADPSRLLFELTETASISDIAQARALVEHLGRLGARTALDDFGTGFASLAYLKQLPVDVIKIDGEFIRDVETDPHSRVLLEAVLALAGAMGKTTIAEWVASPASQAVLRALGVDLGQGFGLGRPAPLEELLGARTDASTLPPITRTVRVLHCDDAEAYRALVRTILAGHEDIQLVGEATGHESAVIAAGRLQPDVVLLDAGVSDARPDVVARLRAAAPGVRVVVLSGAGRDDERVPGHDAWLKKTASADALERAILGSDAAAPAAV